MITSIIRTVVPVIVGSLVAFLVANGIELNDEAVAGLTAFLSGLFTAIYYVLARIIEKRWPEFSWLLGSSKQPTYK